MELKKPFSQYGRDLRDSILRLLRDYSEALTLALVLAFVLRSFVISTYKVTNLTMEPSLRLGDFLIGYKLPYGVTIPFTDIHLGQTTPHRSDLVVFRCPSKTEVFCVKRVAGIAGDRIEILGQRLFVNGKEPKYTASSTPVSEAVTQQARVIALNENVPLMRPHSILISDTPSPNFGPFIVPPGAFFALSDNRDFSEDSRHWGAIATKAIEARIVMIGLSFDWHLRPDGEYDSRLRRERIFRGVH